MNKRPIIFVVLLTLAMFLVNYYFSSQEEKKRIAYLEEKRKQGGEEKPAIALEEAQPIAVRDIHANEQFYVLENPYQQLVFSSLGGSLAEVNLPLRSSKDKNSVVLPIDFDRIMEKQYPANDYFPLFPYRTPEGSVQQGKLGGYYPLIRRAIKSADNRVVHPVSPSYYALNLVSDDPESANTVYTVKRFEKNLIEFEAS